MVSVLGFKGLGYIWVDNGPDPLKMEPPNNDPMGNLRDYREVPFLDCKPVKEGSVQNLTGGMLLFELLLNTLKFRTRVFQLCVFCAELLLHLLVRCVVLLPCISKDTQILLREKAPFCNNTAT